MLHWQISRGRRAHDDPSVPRKGRVFLLERRIPPWHMLLPSQADPQPLIGPFQDWKKVFGEAAPMARLGTGLLSAHSALWRRRCNHRAAPSALAEAVRPYLSLGSLEPSSGPNGLDQMAYSPVLAAPATGYPLWSMAQRRNQSSYCTSHLQ